MAKSDKCPIIGTVARIESTSITVDDGDRIVTLRIAPETYVRNHLGQKLIGDEISAFHTLGSAVIVAYDGDTASVVRPTH